jgi:hypothetical protein
LEHVGSVFAVVALPVLLLLLPPPLLLLLMLLSQGICRQPVMHAT